METAQEAMKRLIRDELSPRLRALGLKGSGGRYALDSPEYFAQIGVQGSQYSSREEARFTVNVSLISRAAWADLRREHPWITKDKPSPNDGYFPDRPWVERMGFLMDDPHDHWWRVRPGQPLGPVADEVAEAVERYALPAIAARMRADSNDS